MIRYLLVIFLVFGSSGILFAEEEKEKEPDEKPHSSAEIALDITKGVVYSAGAGVSAARLNVPGTIAGIIANFRKSKRRNTPPRLHECTWPFLRRLFSKHKKLGFTFGNTLHS